MNLGFGGGGSEFQIPVLSAIVGMIADLMRIGLQICYEFTSGLGFPNYVIAIVVLTILIKTLLLPPRGETDPFHESDAGNTAGDPENPEEVQK